MTRVLGAAAAAVVLAAALTAGGAIAHELGKVPNTPGGKAAAARHNNFRQVGGAFKAINDELKKDAPDQAVLASQSGKLRALAVQVPSWFPKGSGPESGVKTEARAQVWSDAAGFSAAANRFQVESSKLNQFSAAGDIAGARNQARAVGATCKGCHDKYRQGD